MVNVEEYNYNICVVAECGHVLAFLVLLNTSSNFTHFQILKMAAYRVVETDNLLI